VVTRDAYVRADRQMARELCITLYDSARLRLYRFVHLFEQAGGVAGGNRQRCRCLLSA